MEKPSTERLASPPLPKAVCLYKARRRCAGTRSRVSFPTAKQRPYRGLRDRVVKWRTDHDYTYRTQDAQ